jgi:hypothetical protein
VVRLLTKLVNVLLILVKLEELFNGAVMLVSVLVMLVSRLGRLLSKLLGTLDLIPSNEDSAPVILEESKSNFDSAPGIDTPEIVFVKSAKLVTLDPKLLTAAVREAICPSSNTPERLDKLLVTDDTLEDKVSVKLPTGF